MPEVGGKKFPYTAKGKADAKKAAESEMYKGRKNLAIKKEFEGQTMRAGGGYLPSNNRRGDAAESKRMMEAKERGGDPTAKAYSAAVRKAGAQGGGRTPMVSSADKAKKKAALKKQLTSMINKKK